MKKLKLFTLFVFHSLCFSQESYALKLKFDERYFLSNIFTHRTNNTFLLKVFKETDSIKNFRKNKNYVEIMDSLLNVKLKYEEKELDNFNSLKRKEFDSLKTEILNGNFLKLMKSSVKVNFSSNFLEKTFEKYRIKNFKINQTDYNQFFVLFSDKESLERAKTILKTGILSFHESIKSNELESIKNCFLKENIHLVESNNLKKENDYLLVSYETEFLKEPKIVTKCFDYNNISILIKKGKEDEVFSKLYFVKQSTKIENSISHSIKGFDLDFNKNTESYNDNLFYMTIYLDEKGKEYLKEFSKNNIDRTIFISNESQFLLNPKIKSLLTTGQIFLSGNMFEENWQDLFDVLKLNVFKNSLTFE